MAAVLAFAALASVGRGARAESAVSIVSANIVEVCAGTAEHPDADYVVLEVADGGYGYNVGGVQILDHCGALMGWFSNPDPIGALSPGQRVLIARPDAETLFGVAADSSATTDIPLTNGALSYALSAGDLVYGDYPGASAPALPLGKALKWDGAQWQLGEPTPTNSLGVTGGYDAGVSEAGASDAGSDGAAGQGGGDAAADAGYPPCGTGGGGSSSGGTTGAGGTNSGGSGGASPVDASLGGSSSFPPPNRNDDDGCSCRTSPREPWPRGAAWLLTALGVALLRRRAR